MGTRIKFLRLFVLVVFGSFAMYAFAADDPKFTIKEVMEKAHKSGLCKKAGEEKTSKDENKELLELYTALSQNKPPKGDAASWKEKTGALVTAAKAAAAGDKGYGAKVKAAANVWVVTRFTRAKARLRKRFVEFLPWIVVCLRVEKAREVGIPSTTKPRASFLSPGALSSKGEPPCCTAFFRCWPSSPCWSWSPPPPSPPMTSSKARSSRLPTAS
jgi:hypothetical protein